MARYITTVRARLRDADAATAMANHNGIVGRLRPRLEPMGGSGHRVYANTADAREFLAIDQWESLEAMQAGLGDPANQQEIGSLFEGRPEITVWEVRDGWTSY